MVQKDNGIEEFLIGHCEGDLIPWRVQEEASRVFGLAIRAVEEVILRLNLLPARYERNRKAISMAEQLGCLRHSHYRWGVVELVVL
jgi:hypothetical protein